MPVFLNPLTFKCFYKFILQSHLIYGKSLNSFLFWKSHYLIQSYEHPVTRSSTYPISALFPIGSDHSIWRKDLDKVGWQRIVITQFFLVSPLDTSGIFQNIWHCRRCSCWCPLKFPFFFLHGTLRSPIFQVFCFPLSLSERF